MPRYIPGISDPDQAARADRAAKAAKEVGDRYRQAQQDRIRAAKDAVAAGVSEALAAELVGCSKMTLRKWLGK